MTGVIAGLGVYLGVGLIIAVWARFYLAKQDEQVGAGEFLAFVVAWPSIVLIWIFVACEDKMNR